MGLYQRKDSVNPTIGKFACFQVFLPFYLNKEQPFLVRQGAADYFQRSSYGLGVPSTATPTQVKTRLSLVAPALTQIGCPWSSVPAWRTGVIHQRIT
jgi:hypothetical protein